MHEGVFLGSLGTKAADAPATLATYAHLKAMFCYPPNAEMTARRATRFTDDAAGAGSISAVAEGAVHRLPAAPARLGRAVWGKVTAAPNRTRRARRLRLEALVRDVSRKKLYDIPDPTSSGLQPRRWRRSDRPSPASRTS